jgi:polyisoprenyl-phosphate glycosyltransferase
MISIVCPCFNEGEVIVHFVHRMQEVLGDNIGDYELVCVNDGSVDETLPKLLSLIDGPLKLRVIDLSRHFGKEAAISAGLDHADGNAVVVIDADLQDPPELIPRMVERWRSGATVVLARRVDRQADSLHKRATARWFYRLHNHIADTQIPQDV